MLNYRLKDFANLVYQAGKTIFINAVAGDEDSDSSYLSEDSLSRHSSEDVLSGPERKNARARRRREQNQNTSQLN